MSKGTTIKDAINKWEQAEAEKAKEQPDICCKASEAEHVSLIAQIPPVEKMDASLSTLQKCTRLSLSTNCIEKIANLNGLKNLQILSLGRNNIKSLTGLEAVGDTLLELWISYNKIEKLKGINVLKKLKVLYMSNNEVKEMGEFSKLADLPCLVELVFVGNPLCVALTDQGTYKDVVKGKLLKLKKLDGEPVIREQEEEES